MRTTAYTLLALCGNVRGAVYLALLVLASVSVVKLARAVLSAPSTERRLDLW